MQEFYKKSQLWKGVVEWILALAIVSYCTAPVTILTYVWIEKLLSMNNKMEPIDLTEVLLPEHEGKWVALSRDHKRVIAYHESLVELDKIIDDRDVVYMKVPRSGVYLST